MTPRDAYENDLQKLIDEGHCGTYVEDVKATRVRTVMTKREKRLTRLGLIWGFCIGVAQTVVLVIAIYYWMGPPW